MTTPRDTALAILHDARTGTERPYNAALEERIAYEADRAETDRLFSEAGLADV